MKRAIQRDEDTQAKQSRGTHTETHTHSHTGVQVRHGEVLTDKLGLMVSLILNVT